MEFKFTISKTRIREIRKKLGDADVDTDSMTDEEVLQEAFGYIELGMYGSVDIRNELDIRKLEAENQRR